MQQRELQIQHEELVESRKVLADQASAQHEMIIAIQKLATETRFSSRVHAQIALMHETDSTFMKSAEREFLVKMLRETTD
jgi:hypothetical protein